MPIKHAAFKHQRQTKKKTVENKKAKSNLHNLIKSVRKSILAKDKPAAKTALNKAYIALDKAAGKKIIKKNKAARLKSRLSQQINKLGA